ncbi:isochorismate synthase [Flavobacterium sp. 3HN19-14]|uniref:isochorismate synthase n=1 Tax=Flavobacterium sp. 3HN19-14 TaxID=3448133 RepID=UPI003EE41093
MKADLLFEKAQWQFSVKLPFVLYKKPESASVIGIFQHDNQLHVIKNYTEKGYVFAPFNGDKIILIPESASAIMMTDFTNSEVNFSNEIINSENPEAKKEHILLVEKAIAAIQTGDFSKLVISRKEDVDIQGFDFLKAYRSLLNLYPDAFSYCFYHPEIGLWTGAFSEQLLKIKNKMLFTMAVAGTQKWKDNDEIVWGEKEKQEQKFVTDYISNQLNQLVNKVEVSTPYTLKAGKLAHIKTDISAKLNDDVDLKAVTNLLHPTPAVCGLPKAAAKAFILENENYNREYYSGFHGEFNIDFETGEKQTDLFVNLRCMKIDNVSAKATLFIGGGITKDSDPEKEWEETVNKSQTMKQVIN